ncbi:uncharacterized protein LOC126564446, partial [Anopheles maculipalpis]|uniref:uncharacterized protein LOC126564446 n=1 Tax=Anopheles maculipalpis TaxID=1496333 RepID=UPI002159574A
EIEILLAASCPREGLLPRTEFTLEPLKTEEEVKIFYERLELDNLFITVGSNVSLVVTSDYLAKFLKTKLNHACSRVHLSEERTTFCKVKEKTD